MPCLCCRLCAASRPCCSRLCRGPQRGAKHRRNALRQQRPAAAVRQWRHGGWGRRQPRRGQQRGLHPRRDLSGGWRLHHMARQLLYRRRQLRLRGLACRERAPGALNNEGRAPRLCRQAGRQVGRAGQRRRTTLRLEASNAIFGVVAWQAMFALCLMPLLKGAQAHLGVATAAALWSCCACCG